MIVFIVTFMALASVNGEHAPNTVNDGSVRMMMDPRIEAQLMPESDALLTDWEGQHWASLDADQDKVALSWTADEKRITFQVEVASPGWIALALTFRGNIVGSDIIVGWVSSDQIATIVDAHGGPNGEFIRDNSQDYQLIVGYQYQGGTVLRFRRKLNTCDGDDLVITNDTFRVLWFYSKSDPANETAVRNLIAERSGQRSVHLYEAAKPFHRQPEALKWMVASNGVHLPPKHTLYWCTIIKLPRLPSKHHMIGYKAKLTPGSERYVHHMMMYECHDDRDSYTRFDHHVNSGYECNTPNMPNDFKKCKGIVAAWGLGGEPFFLPEEAGYPVGENHGGSNYYMFEVHYDNPGLHGNVVDSSGLEVYLTSDLRKYDSGLLTVGHDVSSFQLIPPGESRFLSRGHCPELCTRTLPEEGVKIFAGLPHTHDLGRSVRLRHLRNGREQKVPFQDRFYDPNYQTMRRFDIHLRPKDHLMLECTYNSTDRETITRGGFSSESEMCLLFLHYYPASRLAHCTSRLTLKHVLLALGVSIWPMTPSKKHLGLRIREPWKYQNLTFANYLDIKGGQLDQGVKLRLQEAAMHHSHAAECFDYGMRRVYADGIGFAPPRISNPVYDLAAVCYEEDGSFTYDPRLNQPLYGGSASNLVNKSYSCSILLVITLTVDVLKHSV